MANNNLPRTPLIDVMKGGEFLPYIQELRERALQGDGSALIALGYIYFRGGGGVPKNYEEALLWFKKVRREDDVKGFVAGHLAAIHYKGLGTAKNQRLAVKYLRRAALCGHGKSRVFFAILQKKGDGTLKKTQAAEVLLRASVFDSGLSVMVRLLALVWLCP